MEIIKHEFINHRSKYLENVIELGDKNSRTLGHLPKVGYEEYGRKRGILILSENSILAGYCLFRRVKRSNLIKIAHLCVKDEYRGKGLSEKLVNILKNQFKESYRGIGLNCRSDYEHACRLWRRCDFSPLSEKRSRSKVENYLTYWQYNFNKVNLFTGIESERVEAVLDLNIIIKLRDNSDTEDLHIKTLFNENFLSEVDYYFAKESLYEITKDSDSKRRQKTREQIYRFIPTSSNLEFLKSIDNDLNDHFNLKNSNDVSDKKQIAESISANINYFITSDEGIINKRDAISEKFPIEILTPTEFIVRIDQITNEEKFISNKLAGTRISIRKVKSGEVSILASKFLLLSSNEKKKDFKEKVRFLCSNENCELKVVVQDEELIGLIGKQIIDSDLNINIIRVVNHPYKYHLFKQLISENIQYSTRKDITKILITSKALDPFEEEILKSFRFFKNENHWFKLLERGISSLENIEKKYPKIMSLMRYNLDQTQLSNEQKYEIERSLYPLKLNKLEIQNLIIPIKPYWASQLFDHYSAESTIFGAAPDLVWNRENVYYRNVNPNIEKPPARILWYCSLGKNYSRTKGIIACSYLDEVEINKPKELFRRYKKYGIYDWKNVYELAKQNVENDIKIINFSDTEVFGNVLKLDEIRNVLEKKHSFQSPITISNKHFLELYKRATNETLIDDFD